VETIPRDEVPVEEGVPKGAEGEVQLGTQGREHPVHLFCGACSPAGLLTTHTCWDAGKESPPKEYCPLSSVCGHQDAPGRRPGPQD